MSHAVPTAVTPHSTAAPERPLRVRVAAVYAVVVALHVLAAALLFGGELNFEIEKHTAPAASAGAQPAAPGPKPASSRQSPSPAQAAEGTLRTGLRARLAEGEEHLQ